MRPIWKKAQKLVNRIPTQEGLDIFVTAVFSGLHKEDLYRVADTILELTAEEEEKANDPAAS